MATIKEVARAAGVSVASVSRFINSPGSVSKEAAARISRAVAALDYHPNSIGRSLRTTRSNSILVLIPSIENGFLSRVIRGIQNVGNRRGVSILIGITESRVEIERSYLNMVRSHSVDGVISVSSSVGAAALREIAREFPLIQCSEYCAPDIPYITIDNFAAAREMVGRLIRRGCRRPGLILADIDILSVRERERGFYQALRDYSLAPDPTLVVKAPLGFTGGRRAAEQMLPLGPDGIFAAADILALGVLKVALDRGIRVPQDLPVAGFDGIQRSRESTPSLTTVLQPAYEIGRTAAEMILERIAGRPVPGRTVLPYRIVERQSTGDRS